MKLHLLNKTKFDTTSFSVSINEYNHFLKLWHYHPELELVVIIKSTGTCFIGDSIEKFEENDIVLIGKNLPHKWLNDDEYFLKKSELRAKALAVHFDEDFLGDIFNRAPEMKPIRNLIERASRGIRFHEVDNTLKSKIINLNENGVFDRTIKFIEILYELANCNNYKLISSLGFRNPSDNSIDNDLDKMYNYIFDNFRINLSSKDVADYINMNHSSFSRFFNRVQRKTFTKYLNEIRVGFACKLLLEAKKDITTICYESGYNNISNFNRHFKEIKNMSPTDFIKLHENNKKGKKSISVG